MPGVYIGMYLNLKWDLFQNVVKVNEIIPSAKKMWHKNWMLLSLINLNSKLFPS